MAETEKMGCEAEVVASSTMKRETGVGVVDGKKFLPICEDEEDGYLIH